MLAKSNSWSSKIRAIRAIGAAGIELKQKQKKELEQRSGKLMSHLAGYGLRTRTIGSQSWDPDSCKSLDDIRNSSKDSPKSSASEHWLLDHKGFLGIVYFVIVLSSLQMGLRIDYPELERVWKITEHLFTALFTLELVVKFSALRCSYFRDSWNRFDFVLVLMAILDNWVLGPMVELSSSDEDARQQSTVGQLPALRVLRVLRVARLARLLRVFKELGMIMTGIFNSLRTIFWVVFLLVLVLYVSSILCVHVIGREELYPGFALKQDEVTNDIRITNWNNYQYFGSISRSMYTLFNIILLTEVETIGRPVFEYQPFMLLFFVVFIVYTTFGVLNVIIGVIVDNTMVAAKQVEEDDHARIKTERLRLLKNIRDLIFALDTNGNGVISLQELKEGWSQDNIWELLSQVNLPMGWGPEDFMFLLDADGDGELEMSEFMMCFSRLASSNEFQHNCSVHASINQMKNMLFTFTNQTRTDIAALDEKTSTAIAALDAKLNTIANRLDVNSGTTTFEPRSERHGTLYSPVLPQKVVPHEYLITEECDASHTRSRAMQSWEHALESVKTEMTLPRQIERDQEAGAADDLDECVVTKADPSGKLASCPRMSSNLLRMLEQNVEMQSLLSQHAESLSLARSFASSQADNKASSSQNTSPKNSRTIVLKSALKVAGLPPAPSCSTAIDRGLAHTHASKKVITF